MIRETGMRTTCWLGLLGLALAYTLFNACKPLLIDDAAYYCFARQMANDPLDPYGFEVFWYEEPEPANHVLAPPVLPYWWSLALRLFGERPFWWKLWLLPFSMLLVGSLFVLARRFARGVEWPLVLMTVCSPALLPSLNLMLDVPALALSLTALALYLPNGGSYSWPRAVLSGLVAGLAMQTKYTSFVVPATMLAHVLLYRRPTRGLVAAMLAFSVFVAWEAVIAAAYGESHFLHAWRRSRVPLTEWVESKLLLAWPLATVLGAVTPYLGLLAFAALGASRRLLIAVGTATVLGYLLVAVVPQPYAAWLGGAGWRLHLDDAVFGAAGLLLLSVLAAVCWRLYHVRPRHQEVLFLLGWLLLEVAAYFALTPFPAARRVFGLLVVFTLLAGRLASRTCRTPQCQPWAGLVLLSGLLGFLFWMVDLCGASAQQRAAELVVERIKAREPAATIWFVGHWGFQFYAERAGARPVIPNVSRLRPGDWLLVPAESHVHQQRIVLDPACLRENDVIALADALPLRTVACYYGGHIPLERQEGPRVVVHAYVVRAAYVPAWRPSRGSRVPQPAAPARGCCIRCVVLSS